MHHNLIIKDGDVTKVEKQILVDGIQLVDKEPIEGSDNLARSGSVAETNKNLSTQSDNIAEAFSASSTYAIGDVVIGPDGKLYQCTTAVETAGEWDATDWTQTTIPEVIDDKIDEVTLDPSAVALGNTHLLDVLTELPADGTFLVDSATNGPGQMPGGTLLDITAKNALAGNVAPEFDSTISHSVGKIVSYLNKVYMFIKAKSAGAWNATYVAVTNIADLIDKLKTDIASSFFIEKNNTKYYDVTFTDGGYISAYSGNYSATASGHCSDFIRVSPGDKFFLKSYLTTSGAKIACYDFWKNYLPSASLITDGNYSGVFEVPSGVSYIRFSSYGSNEYGAHNIPAYDFSAIQKNSDMNVLVFGDSITEDFFFTVNSSGETTAVSGKSSNHMWSYYTDKNLKFKELRNYAKAGASYKDDADIGDWSRLSIAEQVLIAINDKDNPQNVWSEADFVPDVIIFAAGTNDGEPNDTPETALAKIVYDEDGSVNTTSTLAALDRSKFCEAVMWSMLKIRIEFPYALGLCVLPIQRCANDVPFGNVNTYLTTMARRYGFIPVDGISECGIIKDNNKKGASGDTLSDGLHPNTYGAKMMARMMTQAIDRYFYPVFRE